jgi:hypothetical protein
METSGKLDLRNPTAIIEVKGTDNPWITPQEVTEVGYYISCTTYKVLNTHKISLSEEGIFMTNGSGYFNLVPVATTSFFEKGTLLKKVQLPY